MTVKVRHFRSVRRAVAFLEGLAHSRGTYVFRGHNTKRHRLSTTLDRYWGLTHDEWSGVPLRMADQFISGMVRSGQTVPPGLEAQIDPLEYARHQGVPSPLIDFTWSPYVALFFAFNGLSHDLTEIADGRSAVYAVNMDRLAQQWALEQTNDAIDVAARYHEFLWPPDDLLESALPEDTIRFIRAPGQFTQRMHRQMGTFIYCTIDYEKRGARDFEDFLDQIEAVKEFPVVEHNQDVAVTKVILPHECAKDVFQILELMGINAGQLFGSADGVAEDVSNSFFYNPKTSYLRRSGGAKDVGEDLA